MIEINSSYALVMKNLPSPPLPVWSWLQTLPPPQDKLVNDKFNAGKPTQSTKTIADMVCLIRRDTTNSISNINQVSKISKIKM